MDESAEIAALVPKGNLNEVLIWMRLHLVLLKFQELELPTAASLSERASTVFGHREWLNDMNHWVWNAAYIALLED